jgi:hypothetical protein
MEPKFRITPLSTGIGIGTLKPTKNQKNTKLQPLSSPLIPPQIAQQQARQAYAPHSTGTALKKAPSKRVWLWLIRASLGWVLDSVMVIMTLIICSVFSAMAWRLGMGGNSSIDMGEAVSLLAGFLKQYGAKALIVGLIASMILYWSAMQIFIGSTLGRVLRS